MMSLPVWLPGGGFSVQGESLSGMCLCPGVCVQGGLCQKDPTLYGKERAVRILPECILVNYIIGQYIHRSVALENVIIRLHWQRIFRKLVLYFKDIPFFVKKHHSEASLKIIFLS